MTAVSGNTLTAAQWNTHVRDNLNETAPAKATASGRWLVTNAANTIVEREITSFNVSASETTTSTTFTDLTTTGPSRTLTTGTRTLYSIGCLLSNNTAGVAAIASCDISGASTIAPADADSVRVSGSANDAVRANMLVLQTTLTAGSNTFKMQYRVTSASTGTFSFREIIVLGM